MIHLLINAANPGRNATAETRFGSWPSVPKSEFTWPLCRSCAGHMQFLGQLRGARPGSDQDDLLLLFMCQNDPGLCEEWDANKGGNAVVAVLDDDLRLAEPPAEGVVLRDTCYGATILPFAAADYDAARGEWTDASGRSPREVLGQVGGEPAWIQHGETPRCDTCGQSMTLAAQLEEGPDARTEMNFGGGGCAYVFRCQCDMGSAKMLWQC